MLSELHSFNWKLCSKQYNKKFVLHLIVAPQLCSGWRHNYSTKTRQAGRANEQSFYSLMSMAYREQHRKCKQKCLFFKRKSREKLFSLSVASSTSLEKCKKMLSPFIFLDGRGEAVIRNGIRVRTFLFRLIINFCV